MSATNRGSDIIDQEFYPTPKYTINSIIQHIDFSKVQSFTEPCKGEGAIYNLINVPIKHYCELSEGLDYLTTPMPLVDLVLTNPPFSLAQEFITKARTESTTVIMPYFLSNGQIAEISLSIPLGVSPWTTVAYL